MSELTIASLTASLRFVVTGLLRSVRRFKFPALLKPSSDQSGRAYAQPDLIVLNCRVQQTKQAQDNRGLDAFTVQICGSIHASGGTNRVGVRISITDATDWLAEAQPVHSRLKQWQINDSPVFVYSAELGKLPDTGSTLTDWTSVAEINLDWLMFPRKGKRNLQFNVSIVSSESGEEFACAKCTFIYDNASVGYMDLQANIHRAKTLAVALAFAVSAADNKLYDCEVELIKKWARDNVGVSQASNGAKRKLERALDKTLGFFHDGNQVDTHKVCKEIVKIAPVAERYDILELCLSVAQANGIAAAEEIALLKKLAGWLEVDINRFRTLMQKILPASIYEIQDVEAALGVTSDMGGEEIRQRLNKEYCKWNARVTSCDPEVQTQADYMLQFIAEARSEYIA